MKKLFLILAVAMGMTMVSCQKEDDIHLIVPQQDEPQTPAIDLSVDLAGTWTPTSDTYFKVMFYSQSDGSLIDSLYSDMGENGFVLDGQGNATSTPWNVSATYTLDSAQIHFNIMGIVSMDFDLVALSNDHMAFFRVSKSDYQTTDDNGATINVDGIETEYWDLKRE